jgi:hypothetical protein
MSVTRTPVELDLFLEEFFNDPPRYSGVSATKRPWRDDLLLDRHPPRTDRNAT